MLRVISNSFIQRLRKLLVEGWYEHGNQVVWIDTVIFKFHIGKFPPFEHVFLQAENSQPPFDSL